MLQEEEEVITEQEAHDCGHERASGAAEGKEGERAEEEETTLFPLDEFLQMLLEQEHVLWKQSAVLQPFRADHNERNSSGTAAQRENSPSLSPAQSDLDPKESAGFFLMRYGKMTDTIHEFFGKLEKRHACLYLSGRKANFESLRLHPLGVPVSPPPGEVVQSVGSEGRHLVILRDEELLVYRCTLMCAQFPILSAPSPPDGCSPTPSLPDFPLFAKGSSSLSGSSLSRTMPSEFMNSIRSDKSNPRVVVVASDRDKKGKSAEPDTGRSGLPGNGSGSHDSQAGHPQRDAGRKEKPSSETRQQKGPRQGKSYTPSKPMPAALAEDSDDELAALAMRKLLPNSAYSQSRSREQPFTPMVSREMLCSLVRRAFAQTEEQQLQFEHILRHEYGRRSKGEILAKELAGQLQLLENNAHPFYKPRNFVTRNGYDQWLQAEKQHVRNLIDKFWHYSLPRPQMWRQYSPTDHHRSYTILLQKIICCESRTDRREPVHLGKTPSAPLSATAERLLEEYGLRYGVGKLYRKIVYLDYLAKHFDYEIWYIRHCSDELKDIRQMLPVNRSRITAVRRELELLRSTVHLLHGQADNSLTRIKRLFQDSSPSEGVASLIELLKEVLDAEQSLFGKRVRPLKEWLQRYLKSGFVLQYERRKEIAVDEVLPERMAKPFVLTPILINALLLGIRDEVREYKDHYQNIFRMYFNLIPFAKLEFYRLLCSDACSLCSRMIHSTDSRQYLSLEMLGLMYRLNERDVEWQGVISPELQVWRRPFTDLALIWMEVLSKQMMQWILASLGVDEWTLLSINTSLLPKSQSSTVHFTTSLCSSFPSLFPSPFPSPLPRPGNFAISSRSRFRQGGAFVPYQKAMLKSDGSNPILIMSESSGGVSDVSSTGDSLPGPPRPIVPSPRVSTPTSGTVKEKNSSDESMLNFGPDLKEVKSPSSLPTSAVKASEDLEASLSRCAGYDSVCGDALTQHLQEEAQRRREDLQDHDRSNGLLPAEREWLEDATHPPETSAHPSPPRPPSSPPSLLFPLEPEVRIVPPEELLKQPESVSGVPESGVPESGVPESGIPESGIPESGVPESGVPESGIPESGVPESGVPGSESTKLLEPRDDHKEQPFLSVGSASCNSQLVTSIEPQSSITSQCSSFKSEVQSSVNVFGNILDNCADSDELTPKPRKRVHHPHPQVPSDDPREDTETTDTDSVIPAASVLTVPQLAQWRSAHPPNSLEERYESVSPMSTAMEDSHRTQDNGGKDLLAASCNDASAAPRERLHHSPHSPHSPSSPHSLSRPSTTPSGVSSYLFPVSNSVVDLVTMLSRLSHFTGSLLNILIPKLRTTSQDSNQVEHEFPAEVALVRQQLAQLQRNAENTRAEFSKKLHKVMVNCVKLYLDNLLCMDLCGWSGREAKHVLGDEIINHLKRRKEAKEVWGCRHVVEAKYGMHKGGLPCAKKWNKKFENITKDMCVRINNVETLLTIFEPLEEHLHQTVRAPTAAQRPQGPLSYISSDPGDFAPGGGGGRSRPLARKDEQDHSSQPFKAVSPLHRSNTVCSNSSVSSSTAADRDQERPLVGFCSLESDQLMVYLHRVQKFQLKLLCIRLNQFFKPAFSLLMDLKLENCLVEKRLCPIVTFLERHRSALQKYIYPSCFKAVMEYLWECIIIDMEAEALQLQTAKKPVTEKASLLLQSLSHLISFFHDKGNGLSLSELTTPTAFLVSLLEIMMRPTHQLIAVFNRLNSERCVEGHPTLNRAPLPLDFGTLNALRSKLHTYRKCFSGQSFVDMFLELGRNSQTNIVSSVTESLNDSSCRSQNSNQLINSRGQPIVYTVHYACEVAQFLLQEKMLIPVAGPTSDSLDYRTALITPVNSEEEEGSEEAAARSLLSFNDHSLKRTHSSQQAGVEQAKALDSSKFHHQQPSPSPPHPHPPPPPLPSFTASPQSRSRSSSGPASSSTVSVHAHTVTQFAYTTEQLYKFADPEDFEESMSAELFSENLSITLSHRQSEQPLQQPPPALPSVSSAAVNGTLSDFHLARYGTLFLLCDLLGQRSRREREARLFLQTPKAQAVLREKRASNISCKRIFRL